MNKLFIQSSLFALSVLVASSSAEASFLSEDNQNLFGIEDSTTAQKSMVVKRKLTAKRKSVHARSAALVPFYNPLQDENFEAKFGSSVASSSYSGGSAVGFPFASSSTSGFNFVEDDVEEVTMQPKAELKLDEEATLGIIHIQELIAGDQDLSVVLSMKAGQTLFSHEEIFKTFFVPTIQDAINRNGFFSVQTTHLLDQLSEDQKVLVLKPFGHTQLFKAPVPSRQERLKAALGDGLSTIAKKINPFARKEPIQKKRDYDKITSAQSGDVDPEMKSPQSKRRRLVKAFDTRKEKLTYISQALKSHVEEALESMPPFFVGGKQSLSSLIDATSFMSVPHVKMIGYYPVPDVLVQWGEEEVSKLSPALSLNRIKRLELGGNLIESPLVSQLSWNGLERLDLSGNLIRNFCHLLQSDVKSLRLNSNGIEAIGETEIPHATNPSLEMLDISMNLFENPEMTAFLKVVSLLPNLKVLNIGTSSQRFLSSSTLIEGLDVSHPNLQVLGLSGWSLDAPAIEYVLKLRMLNVLDLSNVSFGSNALTPLHAVPSRIEKIVVSSMLKNRPDLMSSLSEINSKGIEIVAVD